MIDKPIHSAMLGLAIGDALGVPVEFQSREALRANPVTKMMGHMCWNQPIGTFSDDSSLTFCLAESLCKGYDIEDMGQTFVRWMTNGYWGAHHKVFDIGGTTSHALKRIADGESAKFSGNLFETDNGNGSLMRILPLAFHLNGERDLEVVFQKVKEVSAITHGHFRSVFACFIYIVFVLELLKFEDKIKAYESTREAVNGFVLKRDLNPKEIELFGRILKANIHQLQEHEISSTGYVLHSLEASLWCLLKKDTYEATVLKAVNLGGDTDTTAAIAGGLAGILYGMKGIPKQWQNQLVRRDDIHNLCDRLATKFN